MAFGQSRLPQLSKFVSGLQTNRNPIDSPISLLGVSVVQHHDVLIDGANIELSAYNTLQRRPGFLEFIAGAATDVFLYKDLNGTLNLYTDTGTSLFHGGGTVQANSAGAGAWSIAGRGNFLYATNGINMIRTINVSPFAPAIWGQATPQTAPILTLQSLGYFNAVTGFVPAADTIAGVLVINDPNHDRVLTITINPSAVHFTIEYTGNAISPNQSYVETTIQTQTGTVPNTTTTDTVTVVNSFSDTWSFTGITNGITNYYPNTGITTVDFDMAYSGNMTMSQLQTLIAQAATETYPSGSNIPPSAVTYNQVFITATLIHGLQWSPGAIPAPANAGVALNITGGFQANILNIQSAQVTVNSGLYSITNPQISLTATTGIAPRLYQYVSPAVNTTDTFTGQLVIELFNGSSNPATTYNFTAQTLQQIAAQLATSSNWSASYVVTGSTCYLVLRNNSFQGSVTSPPTQDTVLCMTTNTLVDLADNNLNFQNWNFISSNDYPQLPQQGVEITYATRDVLSGGLSNIAPPATVVPQIYPCRWFVTLGIPSVPPFFPSLTTIEVYRTVDGGSSYLFEQLLTEHTVSVYASTFSITDAGLNPQLVAPIDEEADAPPLGLRNIITHTGRLWGVVANRVYYSAGPDTINGNGDECWPPGNYFEFPGVVVDIISLDSGLIVGLTDDLHVITGVDSSSYYAKPWLAGFGISNKNAWVKDAAGLYVYTTKQQLHSIAQGDSKEIGFDIGDQLLANFPATTSSVTFHRGSALDTALYISNGTNTIFRYNPAQHVWSPKMLPLIPAGRVKSLETSVGVTTLLNATASGVWFRSLATFTDNALPYSAFFTVGVMQVAPPGQKEQLNNIAMQLQAVGSIPQMWVLFNEIAASTLVPFTRLMQYVNDPPDLPASQTIFQKRWYTQSTLTPLTTTFINLISVKVIFATEAFKNEVLGLYLREGI